MNHKKSIYRITVAATFFVVLAAALPRQAQGQEPREPLTRPEVVRLLENGVSPDRVGALAKQYGIAFQITEDAEKQFRGVGANDELIGMLKALSPPSSNPLAAQPPAPTTPAGEPATRMISAGPLVTLSKAVTNVSISLSRP